MNNKLFVGNLAWAVNDESLKEAFAQYGEVTEARVVTDRESGRSRGFGFVEFADEASAQQAIDGLDGQDLEGRPVNVSIAKSREE